MAIRVKDPISGGTHLIGALLAVMGAVMLNIYAARNGTLRHVVAFSIFGASMILLYTTSSLYHLLPVSPEWRKIFRRIDHMMIFVLIAGTSTPLCLVTLHGSLGWRLFFTVWGLALLGCILKLFWLEAPRWFSTSVYIVMGWIVFLASYPLLTKLSISGFAWFLSGAIFYLIGAIIYATKRPDPFPKWFGFHEIFHLFVMAGTASHFWAILNYVK